MPEFEEVKDIPLVLHPKQFIEIQDINSKMTAIAVLQFVNGSSFEEAEWEYEHYLSCLHRTHALNRKLQIQ